MWQGLSAELHPSASNILKTKIFVPLAGHGGLYLGRLEQEDSRLEAILNYIARLCLTKEKTRMLA